MPSNEFMMIDGKPARNLTDAIKMLLAANKRDLAKAVDEITRLEDGLKQDQPPQKPKFTVIDGGKR